MAQPCTDVEGLVRYLVESLVDAPELVSITSLEDGGTLRIEISTDSEDVGKIIGRNGRIIKAIRTLARAAGSSHGHHVEVDILG